MYFRGVYQWLSLSQGLHQLDYYLVELVYCKNTIILTEPRLNKQILNVFQILSGGTKPYIYQWYTNGELKTKVPSTASTLYSLTINHLPGHEVNINYVHPVDGDGNNNSTNGCDVGGDGNDSGTNGCDVGCDNDLLTISNIYFQVLVTAGNCSSVDLFINFGYKAMSLSFV